MHRTYARVPAHFFRIILNTENDSETLALVPGQENANLIAHILNENYGLRKGESITVLPTVLRSVNPDGSTHKEASTHVDIAIT